MKSPSFRLEPAIAAWRNTLQHERVIQREDLDELEQHVRDQIADLVAKGHSEADAFQKAMETMGPKDETRAAYKQTYLGTLKRERRLQEEIAWRCSMIMNYIRVAFRHLLKQKSDAVINILGLAVGLTSFVLIGLFVRFELSYDRFHEKADRIYRIGKQIPALERNGSDKWTATPAPLVQALMDEIPEVEYATQIAKVNALFEFEDKRFYEDGIFATQHFFQVFSFQLLHGNPETALSDPNAIVLTESLAQKYFRDANPLGRTISVSHTGENFSGKNAMTVTGIVADPPPNSHFSFAFLVWPSSSGDLVNYLDRWDSNSYLTYASFEPGFQLHDIERKLGTLAQKHLGQIEFYQQNPGKIGMFFAQPLTDIHLHSRVVDEFEVNGDIRYVYLFSAIGLVILGIACTNYINLTTARSTTRSVEVGVRKVLGAKRGQLIGQFMGEAIVPSLLAFFIAILLVFLLLPTFSALTGRPLSLIITQHGDFFALLLLAGLVVGILAGGYPALMMSSFKPVQMMKGVLDRKVGKPTLRNTLVVIQFAVAVILVISTIVIQRQMAFIRDTNTGVDREQIVSIEMKDQTLFGSRFEALKQTLLRHPGVIAVTAGQSNPTNINSASLASERKGAADAERFKVYRSVIQHDYVDVFGLELIEGRDFSPERSVDIGEGALINETLREKMGWDMATGRTFEFYGSTFQVIGVVEDFNFHSFHQEVAPVALFVDSSWWFGYQRVFVKVSSEDISNTVASIEQVMADFSPELPFEYIFLDDAYNQLYLSETRLSALLSYFTVLALFITCLGLLGLATFATRQRMKEIGVRKVLGATPFDIVVLLSKDFTRLILIAFVIAAPIGYLLQSRWLEAFAYRISVGWETIAATGAFMLLIAWLTVSFQAVRAALLDPVKSIRYE